MPDLTVLASPELGLSSLLGVVGPNNSLPGCLGVTASVLACLEYGLSSLLGVVGPDILLLGCLGVGLFVLVRPEF